MTTTKQKAGNNWQLGEVASAYILCHKQHKDSVLFGYYTCDCLTIEQLASTIKALKTYSGTSVILSTASAAIKMDCSLTFEGSLAMIEEYKSLWKWSHVLV
uniref:Uncharacterized protein n=1 Tax=Oryza rufipogon TaxID=4529 RepID=A0A0E0QGH5_ORYRU